MRKILSLFALVWLLSPLMAYEGLGAKSLSPKTLAKFAPRPLPPTLAQDVTRFLGLSTPGSGMLTPDAKTLYFTWRISGSSQVWKIDGPNRFPIKLTADPQSTWLEDVTLDGRFVIVGRDADGQENPGIYLLSTANHTLREVYRKTGVQAYYLDVSLDSKKIYFSTNEKRPDSRAIYSYDIDSQKIEEIFAQPGLWSIADDSPHQEEWILSKAISNTHSEFYLFNRKTKALSPLLGQDDTEDYSVIFAARPGHFWVLTNRFGDFHRLYEWKPGGEFKPITPEMSHDVSGFHASFKRKLLFYSVNEGGYARLRRIDPLSYKEIPLPKFEGSAGVYIADIAPDERHVSMSIEYSTRQKASYVLDLKNNSLTQWIYPSAPELNLSNAAPEKLEYYPARDGTPIPMFVYRPPECEKKYCPVIVHFHGGPEGQSTAGFDIYGQLIARQGFIYVEPNVRGSEGYGKTWLHSDNGAKRLQVITDIEDCATHIKKKWAKDGRIPQVGVMGWSYGGYSTLMAMSYFAGAYDAGVALVGMSDLATFLKNTAPYRRALRIAEYGDPVKDKAALKKLSAVNYIHKVKAPLMIIQGAEDPRVPAGEAVQMYNLLQKKKVPSELIIFSDEGHGSAKVSNQILEIGHLIRFFNQHLK